jgi:hypothetical protein
VNEGPSKGNYELLLKGKLEGFQGKEVVELTGNVSANA